MKIYLNEINELDTDLDFTQEDAWVADAVRRLDETQDEQLNQLVAGPGSAGGVARTRAPTPPARATRLHLNLRKVDEVVVVSGSAETQVELICSRCVNPFPFACAPGFSALFCRDPDMAGIAHLGANGGKPVGQNHGYARHAHDTSKDLDITYLSEDFIDLGEILTEQLQLQIPFQPLCRENCRGICARCGTDLNAGRCACAKLAQHSPFSVLRDLKLS